MEREHQNSLTTSATASRIKSVPTKDVTGHVGSKAVQENTFIDRLEAVRGLASMMVACGHSLVIVPSFGWQDQMVVFLQLIMNGRAAVTLFFVLSGLVLGLSLRRSKEVFPIEYAVFCTRRVFRIYPAFCLCTVTIVVYLLYCFVDGSYPSAGVWFDRFFGEYHHPLTARKVIANLFFASVTLNAVTWTLQIEMVSSFLLPFFHRLAAKASALQRIWILAGLIAVGFLPHTYFIGFMFMFFAGYMLPLVGPSVLGYLRNNRQRAMWVVGGALPLLLCSRHVVGRHVVLQAGFVVEGFGAAVLIGCLLYANDFRIYRILDHPVMKFYGRISYSFYLWHFFCLFLVSRWVFALIAKEQLWTYSLMWAGILWLLSTILATMIAYLSYRLVEKPFIRLSKEICLRIGSRRNARLKPQANG